ncbi:MAG: TlpA family protein disulfide reductase [Saprospiraceae bacterium]|nr:TlpA family protein disulfide reductase [Saprospiraceae bacterium]
MNYMQMIPNRTYHKFPYVFIGLVALMMLWISGCVSPHQEFSKLPPGIWRGVLYLDGDIPVVSDKKEISTIQEMPGELPFNFEVVYDNKDTFHIIIHNGTERIRIDEISYGRDKSTAKDTIDIAFSAYDTHIRAIFEERVMEGYWYVNYKPGYRIRFKAFQGDDRRFKQLGNEKALDFSGRYAVKFSPDTEKEYPGVGVFEQQNDKISGTFLTETGDYRYLAGTVTGKKARLSTFDGAHAYLFEFKEKADGEILGEFRSGVHHREGFEGKKDGTASLKSGYELVTIKSSEKLSFVLPNAKGQKTDTRSEPYKGKVKIYEIMGTWCPNCMDATTFLMEIAKEFPEVVITGLAFERYRDSTKALQVLNRYVTSKQIPYEVLLAGYADRKEASALITQIDGIKAYPTLIITDKEDRIQKVFSGFYGPATPEYGEFKTEFKRILHELIQK